MVRLLFIVVAFLIMIGGLIGGLYYWGVDPLAYFKVMIGQAPEDPNKPKIVTGPSYVDFGILIVPVVQDREIKKQVDMVLRLEVPEDKKQYVATNLPRLQHAFLQDMMAWLPVRLRDTSALDHTAVTRRLTKVAEKTLGPGNVTDVVIEQASVK